MPTSMFFPVPSGEGSSFNAVSVHVAMVWFACCCVNHWWLSGYWSHAMIPGFRNSLSLSQHQQWCNRSTSTIHALLMSGLFCYYFLYVNDPSTVTRGIAEFEYQAMYIMTGYLVYDSIYEISNLVFSLFDNANVSPPAVLTTNKKGKTDLKTTKTGQNEEQKKDIKKKSKSNLSIYWSSITLICHHLLGLVSHIAIMKLRCGLAARYMMFIYGAEMSTPFLNVSWLLMSMNLKQTSLYKASGVLLLLTFFWRNFIGIYMMFSLTLDASSWEGATLNGSSHHKDEMLYRLLYGITFVFVLLNATWTYKLVKSAFKNLL